KLRAGRLTLTDFMEQLKQEKKMGPLEGIIGMLPGAGKIKNLAGALPTDDQVKEMEAIILSITPLERERAEAMDGSSRRRIGPYDTMTEPVKLNIDEEKIKAWLQKGARPSDTARAFLIGRGLLPKESAKKRATKPTKAEAAAAAAKAAPEAGAPVPAAAATQEA